MGQAGTQGDDSSRPLISGAVALQDRGEASPTYRAREAMPVGDEVVAVTISSERLSTYAIFGSIPSIPAKLATRARIFS